VKRLGAEEDDEEGVEEEEAEVDSPAAIRRRQLAALQVCVRMLSFFCPFFFCVRMPSRTRISTYHSSMYSMAVTPIIPHNYQQSRILLYPGTVNSLNFQLST
jgi:hypothetical protein